MPEIKEPLVQVRLNQDNSDAVRDIAIDELRSETNVVNKMVAECVLKRAVKSLPSKKKT